MGDSRLEVWLTTKHIASPTAVGRATERSAHLRLPVSFLIVMQVVEHGQ